MMKDVNLNDAKDDEEALKKVAARLAIGFGGTIVGGAIALGGTLVMPAVSSIFGFLIGSIAGLASLNTEYT